MTRVPETRLYPSAQFLLLRGSRQDVPAATPWPMAGVKRPRQVRDVVDHGRAAVDHRVGVLSRPPLPLRDAHRWPARSGRYPANGTRVIASELAPLTIGARLAVAAG